MESVSALPIKPFAPRIMIFSAIELTFQRRSDQGLAPREKLSPKFYHHPRARLTETSAAAADAAPLATQLLGAERAPAERRAAMVRRVMGAVALVGIIAAHGAQRPPQCRRARTPCLHALTPAPVR